MGSGSCRICDHPQRDAIETDIKAGTILRDIAAKYNCGSRELVRRHRRDHMGYTPGIDPLLKSRALDTIENLVSAVERKMAQLEKIEWRNREHHGSDHTAIEASRGWLRLAEVGAKLKGYLQEQAAVQIVMLPEWLMIKESILRALDPHPEARRDVIKALDQLKLPEPIPHSYQVDTDAQLRETIPGKAEVIEG